MPPRKVCIDVRCGPNNVFAVLRQLNVWGNLPGAFVLAYKPLLAMSRAVVKTGTISRKTAGYRPAIAQLYHVSI